MMTLNATAAITIKTKRPLDVREIAKLKKRLQAALNRAAEDELYHLGFDQHETRTVQVDDLIPF